ncbi:hypothetical protein [Chitinophaga filiformis]|uniref:Uncharacterized protein n=1 Tax=Chitinophaga filiformis TaxID=104663 RepID=A0ABY4IBS0_CHIFI|nr:hypothetical protein [Chitinophaga filiformis]UPK72473.1 hypothetical protein MYF79_14365 [Chitinophaga filiformis]
MMDINTYQNGNLVFDEDKNLCRVETIILDIVIYSIMESDWTLPIYKTLVSRLKSIPLTMIWAKRLQFNYDDKKEFSRYFGTVKYAFLPDQGLHYYGNDKYIPHECNTVHAVQNLYKSYTGEELDYDVWADFDCLS